MDCGHSRNGISQKIRMFKNSSPTFLPTPRCVFPEFRENRENRETREGEPTATQNRRTRMPVRCSTLPYYCWLVVKELRSSLYSVCPIRAGLFRELLVFPIFPKFDEIREIAKCPKSVTFRVRPQGSGVGLGKSVQRTSTIITNTSLLRWPRLATMAPSRRINQSTARGRVTDFPDFGRKSGKSVIRGGRNRDLSGWGHGVDHDAAGL